MRTAALSDLPHRTMPPHLAFLHTSPVHVATFDELVKAFAPDVRVDHVVDEALLADAQRVGADQPELVARVQAAMAHAARKGASLVVCTCSTIGGAAERTPAAPTFSVARIDRAMADRAVRLGSRILVVAALQSTIEPTVQLIGESAHAAQAKVNVQTLLMAQAWPHFKRGDRTAYVDAVAAAVRDAAPGCHAVVLAQASMAPAADVLRDLGIEVLSSPVLGVRSALARLRATGSAT